MRSIVGRVLADRFWQAGISEGSKQDFYNRITGTKSTLEGFASSIRGVMRSVRDACYSIFSTMARMDVHFYGFKELPGPLAHALFSDAHCLSSHQFSQLLKIAQHLVDECPVDIRAHFLPPMLATAFSQIDAKVGSEWATLNLKIQTTTEDENLAEEMKEESILRQLTYAAVNLIASIFDPNRESQLGPLI